MKYVKLFMTKNRQFLGQFFLFDGPRTCVRHVCLHFSGVVKKVYDCLTKFYLKVYCYILSATFYSFSLEAKYAFFCSPYGDIVGAKIIS